MGGGKALVVGGGIGGLAAATGLRLVGWDVTVLERSPVLADVGGGISLHANGVRALDALGVGEAVRAAARPQYTGGTRAPDGSWLIRMDGKAIERAAGVPVLGVRWSALHRVLRAALPPECLLTGREVTSVERTGRAGAQVSLVSPARTTPEARSEADPAPLEADPAQMEADLVVVADGVHSRLRGTLFPHHPGAVYSGSTVLRAVTDRPIALPSDLELTWGKGAEFGHITFVDGHAEWHAVLTSPPGGRYADALAAMRDRFAGWHDPIPALLEATRPDAVLHHDIHELVTPLPCFTAGPIALLGDAAHAMTPNLGQGAGQALEDATVLAAALASEPTLASALAHYDTVRRHRTRTLARAARQAGRAGHRLTNPTLIALRDTALRLTPSRPVISTFLRHTRWTPPSLG
ncbi:FAD-dependent monooxygenase [Streptomyces ipomoeae]|uniref:FAD-dependent monooxygenase n=1 Tax=Streptomyces ipomoeae TaxID=103232 RepID=UPI0029B318C5|nr:FAD-dependent monooxygenase [Streptomyces ipomoeae]MDX2697531.1 FAD-dependent monooxygenase [Streptomyces ipomoeae]MDX2844816.1 FAD-dependent monooxygenase [Streptomyces ipomoeae]